VEFGPYIRQRRHELGLTQRQLAEKAGIDFTYLSKIENGRVEHTPSIKAIRDLARALDVDELDVMQRAKKVPAVFEAVVRDEDALRFFRRATETITSPEGWRDLLDYLERRHDAP